MVETEAKDNRDRILHYPADVGGHPTGLSQAERRLGVESTVAVIARSPFGFDVDVDLDLGRRSRLGRLMDRTRFAARSVRRYDVFHFNFGQTMLPRLGPFGIDLPLLRIAGKRLFMTFQGCDARRTDHCRAHCGFSACGGAAATCRADGDARRSRDVAYAARYCHRLFCLNPDLLRLVPSAEFVPYAALDPAHVEPAHPRGDGPLVIVHAPTDRMIKGTDHVIRAVEELTRHFDVELRLVAGVTRTEALAAFRDADLAIDQLHLGWYGGFAVEMMAMARPVVCHLNEDDFGSVPSAMVRELPVVRATTDSLTDVVAGLLAEPERRADVGRRSRAFVERWHDPARIARRMLEVYRDPSLPFWDASGALPALDSASTPTAAGNAEAGA